MLAELFVTYCAYLIVPLRLEASYCAYLLCVTILCAYLIVPISWCLLSFLEASLLPKTPAEDAGASLDTPGNRVIYSGFIGNGSPNTVF